MATVEIAMGMREIAKGIFHYAKWTEELATGMPLLPIMSGGNATKGSHANPCFYTGGSPVPQNCEGSPMPLQCNIDARGKRLRFINGGVLTLVGVLLLLFWAIPAGGWMAWAVSLFVLACGAFSLFEARAGWCAVRAMGFKDAGLIRQERDSLFEISNLKSHIIWTTIYQFDKFGV